MRNLDYREYYRRNLLHIQPRGTAFLINYRLAGSLPVYVVEQLKADAKEKLPLHSRNQEILMNKWDDAPDEMKSGPFWLKDERIAQIVATSITYHDGDWFDLLAYCIMPNHVHLVLVPYQSATTADYSLTKIMHNINRNSANLANKILNRTGAFWQHENYDHFMSDEAELERIIKYVLHNPVKANLVKEQRDWIWSYCKYEM